MDIAIKYHCAASIVSMMPYIMVIATGVRLGVHFANISLFLMSDRVLEERALNIEGKLTDTCAAIANCGQRETGRSR